jgi:hypothetical protein
MPCCDGFQCGFEIGVWLDVVERACLDERGDVAPVAPVFIVTCEERVFPVEGNRTDAALHGIAVHLGGTVIKEQL